MLSNIGNGLVILVLILSFITIYIATLDLKIYTNNRFY